MGLKRMKGVNCFAGGIGFLRQKEIFFFAVLFFIVSCSRGFEAVNYGHDQCAHCRMTIMDKRFAAELLTGKGKAIKFDDISCLKKYLTANSFIDNKSKYFVADYKNPEGEFLDAGSAVYLHHESLKSPMNGNYAAFKSEEEARSLKDSLGIPGLNFEGLE
jgi:copper chaperone NosL